jgi:DNA modification methylase
MSRALAYQAENSLNAICPYFTMFPLEYPIRVLRRHKKDSPVVMDPFCGRGTTLFAARKLGLVARGIDASPIAVAIAQAKLAIVDTEGVLKLAHKYIEEYSTTAVPDSEFFRYAFTPQVLQQICAIRMGLLRTRSIRDDVVVLRASMLGCLHGPLNKTEDSRSYFSNQMPRTFSSKPDYSVRFWKTRGMEPPVIDVVSVLRRKLERLQNEQIPSVGAVANAKYGDSRLFRSLPQRARDFSVVVTSPPYYGMRTYIQDQWLRNWFVGGLDHVEYANDFQLEHTGTSTFADSLGRVWKNMARTDACNLDMYIRFGIIPSSKVDAKALLRASLESSGVRWREVSVRKADTASSGKRQADHMAAGSTAALEFDFHIERV